MGERAERRQFRRTKISCPITIHDGQGRFLAKAVTSDVSDTSAFAPLPIEDVPACGSRVALHFAIPRMTPNTYMMEEFDVGASVVRHQALSDDRFAGVALQFDQPVALDLDA